MRWRILSMQTTKIETKTTNNNQRPPLIQVKNMSKHYGSVCALDNISALINSNEILGIIGDNGAGKSTFVNILSGAVSPDQGAEIFIEGEQVTIDSPGAAATLGISTVYQDLALCNNMDAYQNIFLGREICSNKRLDKPAMEKRSKDLFQRIGSNVPNPEALVGTRSGGQRQAIAIARSVLEKSKAIFMDEPTAALGIIQRKQISILMQTLKDEGLGVVWVSQDLPGLEKIADRVLVFRVGKLVAELTGDEINYDNMVAHVTGANVVKTTNNKKSL